MCGFYRGRKVTLRVNEGKVLAEITCFFFFFSPHPNLFFFLVTSSPTILSPVAQPE